MGAGIPNAENNQMIRVHFKNGMFIIDCPFMENSLLNNIHGKTFRKKDKAWVVKKNKNAVDELSNLKDVFFSPEAEEEIKNYESPIIVNDEPFPSGYEFKLPPMPHQRKALDVMWKHNIGAMYADPGTGKTKVAIDTACARKMIGKISNTLVIALVSIKKNWEDEININSPLKTLIHRLDTSKSGQKKYQEFLDSKHYNKWLIVGIESISSGGAYELMQKFINPLTMIIIDESSSIKHHDTKRTERAIAVGELVKYKMIMTGTPITQGLTDVYSQFNFLCGDVIGHSSFYSFRNNYCLMGGYESKNIIGYKNLDELVSKISPYIFQVRKRDVIKDLPDFTKQVRYVQLSPEQKVIYKQLKDTLKIESDKGSLVIKNAINKMQRLSEITGGHISYQVENTDPFTCDKKPFIYQRNRLKTVPKLTELVNIINEMPDDEQVLIWTTTQNSDEIYMIAEKLRLLYGENSVGMLMGSVKEETRNNIQESFQKGLLRFIVGNPKVGGIGLNFTAARYTIYYSRDFSLEVSVQSEARMDRIGQKRKMTYFDIVCEKTIDEYILKSLSNNLDFAEVIREAIEDEKFLTDLC